VSGTRPASSSAAIRSGDLIAVGRIEADQSQETTLFLTDYAPAVTAPSNTLSEFKQIGAHTESPEQTVAAARAAWPSPRSVLDRLSSCRPDSLTSSALSATERGSLAAEWGG
jgi:hypothetical protein